MKTLDYQLLPADHKTQLGLIVLQSDVTLEDEFRAYFPNRSVSLLANRIPFENEVTSETLKQMEGHIARTMSLFPLTSNFDTVGYACTSGALHIGSERIQQLIKNERSCKSVTNPMKAALSALAALKARRIAFLAPYSQSVTQSMIDAFSSNGIDVQHSATFDESQDAHVGRISPQSIRKEAVELCSNNDVDAVFIACTNMKCAHVIPQIEAQTGVTALSSNLVLAWDMARLSGQALQLEGLGRLAEFGGEL